MAEFERTQPGSKPAADPLLAAMRATKGTATLQLIFLIHPTAERVARKLAHHLSSDVLHPGSGVPLLHFCLRDAVDRFGREVEKGAAADSPSALVGFIGGLFQPIPAILERQIVGRTEAWDPVRSPAFGEWKQGQGKLEFNDNPPTSYAFVRPTDLRKSLALRLMDVTELDAANQDLAGIAGG